MHIIILWQKWRLTSLNQCDTLGDEEDEEDEEIDMPVQTIRKSKRSDVNNANVQKYHLDTLNEKDLDEEIKKIRNELICWTCKEKRIHAIQ